MGNAGHQLGEDPLITLARIEHRDQVDGDHFDMVGVGHGLSSTERGR